MQVRTKKRLTDGNAMARFIGPQAKISEIKKIALSLGLTDMEDRVDYREAFPEYKGKENQTALRAYRLREGLTQVQIADLAGIPRRHISDMENGRRPIGKENAKKLADVLNTDYRMLL
ncbi:MAG: helix-turn-helix transcriptional regulator [Desulfobacteraceae bacterium]|jgi:DNA-binding XRE family transcriptional regulator